MSTISPSYATIASHLQEGTSSSLVDKGLIINGPNAPLCFIICPSFIHKLFFGTVGYLGNNVFNRFGIEGMK